MARVFTPDEMRVWIPFVITTLRLFATLDADLKAACDLSHLDYGMLNLISAAPDGQRRMHELAETFGVDPSVITYRVRRMEARGLVERGESASDGRAVLARITTKGLLLLEEAVPLHVAGVRRLFLDHVDADELRALAAVFGRLLAAQHPPVQRPDAAGVLGIPPIAR